MLKWIPFIFIFLILIIILIYLIFKRHDPLFPKMTLIGAWVYAFFICRICFAPVSFGFTSPHEIHYFLFDGIIFNLIPFQSLDTAFWMNVLMTVPAGIFYQLIIQPTKISHKVLLGIGTGLFLECTQMIINFLVHLGRWVEVDDLITNACGVWIGMIIVYFLLKSPLQQLTRKFMVNK